MIISSITGGLGNQLFQYAMGRRLAEHHGVELLLDTANYGPQGEARPVALKDYVRPLALQQFKIKAGTATPDQIRSLKDDFTTKSTRDRVVRQVRRLLPSFLRKKSHIIEHQFRFQPEALSFQSPAYLQGFWQSEKYFADIVPIIREEFCLKDDSISRAAIHRVDELRSKHGVVVSLHVRRGDLAHAQENLKQPKLTHAAPVTRDYIRAAMNRFSPDVCFYVFSDSEKDIHWCRENIQALNLEFSSAESDLYDFASMTACDHHIIANSSFSWWAAWLDANPMTRVIAPKEWALHNPAFPITTEDLLPQRWEVI